MKAYSASVATTPLFAEFQLLHEGVLEAELKFAAANTRIKALERALRRIESIATDSIPTMELGSITKIARDTGIACISRSVCYVKDEK
jgi:hypothetical protein